MRVRVCTISWNESRVIDYFLRHYESIAEHIVFYHEDSTDGTTEAGGGLIAERGPSSRCGSPA